MSSKNIPMEKCNLTNNSADKQSFYQNVVVMRHGDRMDNFDPLWATTAVRPWDPPLVGDGKVRAYNTGLKLRAQLGFPIHRVFVSPFLRCLQTASQVVSALSSVDHDPTQLSSDGVRITPSKIQVSVEYGLCEMLNKEAIRPQVAPKDGNFGFNISQCEAMLPSGTVDNTVERVYKELPKWEETVADARFRYAQVIKTLAEKFPLENLLLVTHGEGVRVSVSTLLNNIKIDKVKYCAYSHSRRHIIFSEKQSFTAGDYEMVTHKGQTGITYSALSTAAMDTSSMNEAATNI